MEVTLMHQCSIIPLKAKSDNLASHLNLNLSNNEREPVVKLSLEQWKLTREFFRTVIN